MPEEKSIPEIETQPASPEAQLRDKRTQPEGVVPKQAQGYVVAGLAVLILMAVMFSRNHPKTAAKNVLPPPSMASSDANQRKIQELEQDLSDDQRQGEQQEAQKVNAPQATTGAATPPARRRH